MIFNLQSIEITGCTLTTQEDILEVTGLKKGIDLKTVMPETIKLKLEAYPYIKAAVVSKHFPDKLQIQIKERIPICFVNHGKLSLANSDGILLPLPNNYLRSDLPVISGFTSDSINYVYGKVIQNPKIINLINLLNKTIYRAPNLYSEISEIKFRQKQNDYIAFSINSATPIYFGKENLSEKFNILAHFQYIIKEKKQFKDYLYLDLRWNNQIIAKEKHS